MALTDDQLERYARHIVLKEIGGAGQARLLSADVAVVGAAGSAARPSSISPRRAWARFG
ncbi:molybdopterin biosynthesis protein MoeB [Sphingobium fuliginis]|uniref:Molybdopterin biosynthesis protein MoeB n=1 Tax=Sphingobium fuliginis (strain ATCC 27551) TaxID=336203 RepID=A0A292ZH58_SPHSA|nr:molybdopterin biosynthesis protein MoeB [Sphingobium fuliginis]